MVRRQEQFQEDKASKSVKDSKEPSSSSLAYRKNLNFIQQTPPPFLQAMLYKEDFAKTLPQYVHDYAGLSHEEIHQKRLEAKFQHKTKKSQNDGKEDSDEEPEDERPIIVAENEQFLSAVNLQNDMDTYAVNLKKEMKSSIRNSVVPTLTKRPTGLKFKSSTKPLDSLVVSDTEKVEGLVKSASKKSSKLSFLD